MTLNAFEQNPHQPAKASLLLFSLVWHGLALTILLVVLLAVVPKFDKMFEEFGLKLPVASVLVINLSRRLLRYGLLIIPLGMILDGGMLCFLTLVDGIPRSLRQLWFYGVLALAGGTLLLIAIGIILPLLDLVQGLA